MALISPRQPVVDLSRRGDVGLVAQIEQDWIEGLVGASRHRLPGCEVLPFALDVFDPLGHGVVDRERLAPLGGLGAVDDSLATHVRVS